jgi:hypothetical protein
MFAGPPPRFDEKAIWEPEGDQIGRKSAAGSTVKREGAPARPDGSKMRIIGASWFRYGGDYRWCEQRDFYDFGRTMEFIDECADRGIISELALQRRTERNKRLIQMLEQRLAYLRKSIGE